MLALLSQAAVAIPARAYSLRELAVLAVVWCVIMGLLAHRILRTCDATDATNAPTPTTHHDRPPHPPGAP